MKRMFYLLLLSVFIVGIQTSDAQQVSKNVIQQIQKAGEELNEMVMAGNVGKFQNYYMVDVVSMPNYGEMIIGLQDLIDHNKKMQQMGFEIVSLETQGTNFYGNSRMVVEAGNFKISLVSSAVEAAMVEEGSYINYWVKKSGKWMIQAEIWNTSENPLEKYEEYLMQGDDDTPGHGTDPQKKPDKTPTGGDDQQMQKNPEQTTGEGSKFDPPKTQTKEPEKKPEKDPNKPDDPNNESDKSKTIKVKLK